MALENYTTYSEYDASGLVTVGANTLAVAGNNNTAFSVHKVFEAGHFSGDFEHVVAAMLNNDGAANYTSTPFWGLSNETAESAHSFKQIQEASGDCLYIRQYENTTSSVWIRLIEVSTGTDYWDEFRNGEYDTWYYCEIERDESTGTYGTLLCRIYSDESRSTLVDTLSVTLHKKADFRTVYAVSSYYNNSNRPYSQNIKNLDLQEVGTIKSFYVADGGDDGDIFKGNMLISSGVKLDLGGSKTLFHTSAFMRFTNVAIPSGATIDAANIVVVSDVGKYDGGTTPSGSLKGRKLANCPQITTIEDYNDTTTYPHTTANVTWWPTEENWGMDTSRTSPELKTIVQEIVDLEGWASGNAIQIEWHYIDNGWYDSADEYTGDYRLFYAYEHATFNPPILNVVYTVGTAAGNPWWYYRKKRTP